MANYYREIEKIMGKLIYKILLINKNGVNLGINGEKLSFLDIYVIAEIGDCKEKSMYNLIKDMEIDRNDITLIINRMIALGYITKEKSERDRRVYILKLTEDGNHLYNKILEEENKLLDFILKDITLNEEKAVLKFLSKINQTTLSKYEYDNDEV